MKKFQARTILLAFLTAASLGSYLYLNSISAEHLSSRVPQIKIEQDVTPAEEANGEGEEVRLPGATLKKIVFQFGERFISN